jgi:hypothetical protein
MDGNTIQKERARINRIISRYAHNYASPIIIPRQPFSTLRRHQKFYSFDAEPVKIPEQHSSSISSLVNNPSNSLKRSQPEPLTKKHEESANIFHNQLVQHIFTFQTLREVIANNPNKKRSNDSFEHIKGLKGKKINQSEGRKTKKKKEMAFFGNEKAIKNKSPTFLRIVSKRILTKDEKEMNKEDLTDYGDIYFKTEDTISNNDRQRVKDERSNKKFLDKLRGNKLVLSRIIKEIKPSRKHQNSISVEENNSWFGEVKNKALHIVLPNSNASDPIKISLPSSQNADENSIKGWET